MKQFQIYSRNNRYVLGCSISESEAEDILRTNHKKQASDRILSQSSEALILLYGSRYVKHWTDYQKVLRKQKELNQLLQSI